MLVECKNGKHYQIPQKLLLSSTCVNTFKEMTFIHKVTATTYNILAVTGHYYWYL